MNSKRWIVQYIEILVDIVVLVASYLVANRIKFGFFRTGLINHTEHYLTLLLVELVAYVVIHILFFADGNLVERSALREVYNVAKMYAYIAFVTVAAIYFTKTAEYFSREQIIWTFGIGLIATIIGRRVLRRVITKSYHRSGANQKIMLITTSAQVEKIIKKIKTTRNWDFRISNIAVIDKDMTDEIIDKIEVVANRDNVLEVLANAEIDAVFVHLPSEMIPQWKDKIDLIYEMGKTVHLNVNEYEDRSGEKHLDFLGKFAVVTWENKYYRVRHLLVKRLVDVIAGLVGVVLTAILWPVLGIIKIFTRNKGPVIIPLMRVGKNGRRFYYFKFRTMPLVAGGKEYTAVGKVLRDLRIENLPCAWNLLWGDMSLVGNVSPSLPEYIEYSVPHRKSLSMKPGIISFWQVYSDKKDIQTEEEQCEFDQEYLQNWSVGLDFSIIVRALLPFVRTKSKRPIIEPALRHDERQELDQIYEEHQPLSYDKSAYTVKKGFGKLIYLGIKRLFDIVVSLICLIVLSPVLLIIALVVKLGDGGSIFYGHTRIGYKGKKISVYKFRSMKTNAGELEKILTPEQLEQYITEFKIDNDPRVTKIGKVLRKTSLDELPQLLNILKGDLSIVGPRPIVEKETQIYGEDVAKLLSVKPGLTGYWQAYARNNATYESGERQKMEMYYVEHNSLWLDIKIIFRTFFSVIKEDGAQ